MGPTMVSYQKAIKLGQWLKTLGDEMSHYQAVIKQMEEKYHDANAEATKAQQKLNAVLKEVVPVAEEASTS